VFKIPKSSQLNTGKLPTISPKITESRESHPTPAAFSLHSENEPAASVEASLEGRRLY